MDIESSKKKLAAIETNIAIYKNDLKRMIKDLDKNYDLKESEIGDRVEEIEDELEVLRKKKRKLKIAIEKELDHVNA